MKVFLVSYRDFQGRLGVFECTAAHIDDAIEKTRRIFTACVIMVEQIS